ncbi:MAG: AAA family ATPase [Thermodesulfobacteria bacterium]|nr:AAA family ATPase [Thermodesulfobacteriota bacterium]
MENINPDWLDSLLKPDAYPHRPKEIKLIQTHLSWVFLADEYVFKVKKPVDFGFLDFTTLEKRHFFCNEEIRLNKRLCPDIYVSVVPITKEGSKFVVEGSGDVVEWAVKMNRMPDDGLMSALIKRDEVDTNIMDKICDILVPFYQKARAPEDKVWLGGIDVVKENCTENFIQTEDFVGKALTPETYNKIVDYTNTFLEEKKELFKRRQDQGWIVEGHGDLYSANICIDKQKDKIYIFDCIEFNERFRYGDICVDIAFLAMDLDFLGLCDLSNYFIENFKKGINDQDLYELLDFYKCYRAYVRGKIGCFTWASPEVDEETRQTSLEMAKRYFKLALRYAGGLGKTPTLYVFMGLSGTGKSTLANALGKKLAIETFNSDVVRKEYVSGISAKEKRLEPFGKGIYSKEFTQKTYRALKRLAAQRLILGEDVILDATYLDPELRAQVANMAKACGARYVLVHCTCPEDVAISRMQKRMSSGESVSDGREEIYKAQKELLVPPSKDEADVVMEIDTSEDLEQLVKSIESVSNGSR